MGQIKSLGFAALLWTSLFQFANGFGDSFGISPYWDFKQFETEHFLIVYPKEVEAIAFRAADYLEEAHRTYSPLLQWEPRTKTNILVVDNSDAANGLTGAVDRFGMILWAVPPNNWFPTAFYSDYLQMLVVHEYIHMLNIDPTRGLPEILRIAFGDWVKPNQLWPRWMIEGLAVYYETRGTLEGRGRSPMYSMFSRSAVEDGTFNTPEFITLDMLEDYTPWHPAGEIPYYFGYNLFNEIRLLEPGGTDGAEKAFGDMSIASSGSFPYLINMHLKNYTGRDWYEVWQSWIERTHTQASSDIDKIKKRRTSEIDWLTKDSIRVLGSAVSPNGRWLAYHDESYDEIGKLYVQDLHGENEPVEVMNKIHGVGMSFSPDSKYLFFSALNRKFNWYLWNDLGYYDVENEEIVWLTDSERASDPDVSKDGSKIVYVKNVLGKSTLVMADIDYTSGDELQIKNKRTIYEPEMLDRVANPKFDPETRRVIFSLKKSGTRGEDLVRLHLYSRKFETLAKDGNFNRFPAFDRKGKLYFISDRSGVDNLYRYNSPKKATQVTNLVSGMWFPTFDQSEDSKTVYGTVFRNEGWNLAKVSLNQKGFPTKALTIKKPNAPKPNESAKRTPKQGSYTVEDYSLWPTLLPRRWGPIIGYNSTTGGVIGLGIFGRDNTDRLGYDLGYSFHTNVSEHDYFATISNRFFGPTIDISASNQVNSFITVGNVNGYEKRESYSVSASFPWRDTFDAWVPSASFDLQKDTVHAGSTVTEGSQIPNLSAQIFYTSVLSSRLGITGESGRRFKLAFRNAFRDNGNVQKVLMQDIEYWKITDHSVLVPSIAVAASSTNNRNSSSVVVGAYNPALFNTFRDTNRQNLDRLRIRGYPGFAAASQYAGVASLDFRFPIYRIYRGWGTRPVYFREITGYTFVESAVYPENDFGKVVLPSFGGGLQLRTSLLEILALTFSGEVFHGLENTLGGDTEFIFTIRSGASF